MSTTLTQFVIRAADEQKRLAECAFATLPDLKKIAAWPRQVPGTKNQITEDALEFAKLAREKWYFNRRKRRTASGIASLRRKIASDRRAEVALLCVGRADWAQEILGITLFRRTWCNHLVVDFLATHPVFLLDGPDRLRGIGTGLLFGISIVAAAIGAKVLWAETTDTSAPVYQEIFHLNEVKDLLVVGAPQLRAFRQLKQGELRKSGLRKER
jgi:hypothetical protein